MKPSSQAETMHSSLAKHSDADNTLGRKPSNGIHTCKGGSEKSGDHSLSNLYLLCQDNPKGELSVDNRKNKHSDSGVFHKFSFRDSTDVKVEIGSPVQADKEPLSPTLIERLLHKYPSEVPDIVDWTEEHYEDEDNHCNVEIAKSCPINIQSHKINFIGQRPVPEFKFTVPFARILADKDPIKETERENIASYESHRERYQPSQNPRDARTKTVEEVTENTLDEEDKPDQFPITSARGFITTTRETDQSMVSNKPLQPKNISTHFAQKENLYSNRLPSKDSQKSASGREVASKPSISTLKARPSNLMKSVMMKRSGKGCNQPGSVNRSSQSPIPLRQAMASGCGGCQPNSGSLESLIQSKLVGTAQPTKPQLQNRHGRSFTGVSEMNPSYYLQNKNAEKIRHKRRKNSCSKQSLANIGEELSRLSKRVNELTQVLLPMNSSALNSGMNTKTHQAATTANNNSDHEAVTTSHNKHFKPFAKKSIMKVAFQTQREYLSGGGVNRGKEHSRSGSLINLEPIPEKVGQSPSRVAGKKLSSRSGVAIQASSLQRENVNKVIGLFRPAAISIDLQKRRGRSSVQERRAEKSRSNSQRSSQPEPSIRTIMLRTHSPNRGKKSVSHVSLFENYCIPENS